MSIWLEDNLRDALDELRFEKDGESVKPEYFVEVSAKSMQLETRVASYIAHFISERLQVNHGRFSQDSDEEDLGKFSPETIADYLEDLGYTVCSPDG